jgi:hypothetical protein
MHAIMVFVYINGIYLVHILCIYTFLTYQYVSDTYQYVPLHRIRIWHVFWLCGIYEYVVANFSMYWYVAVRTGTYWINAYLVCI